MSSVSFTLDAENRTDTRKGANRRLRHDNKLPAIIYGGGKESTCITLAHNKIQKALSFEAFYSHILEIKLNDKVEKVILKAVQRHPAKPLILHMDFQRIQADQLINMQVPLHFVGEDKAPGRIKGGIFSHLMTEVEISCLPANLPEFIQVDVSSMELNDSLHLSELALPTGVEIKALGHDDEKTHDQAVISLHLPRKAEEEPATATTDESVEESKATDTKEDTNKNTK